MPEAPGTPANPGVRASCLGQIRGVHFGVNFGSFLVVARRPFGGVWEGFGSAFGVPVEAFRTLGASGKGFWKARAMLSA